MTPRSPGTAVAMLAALSCPALAADPTEEESLEEIVVSAARIERAASAIAGTVTVIGRAAIEQQAALRDDLASVLSHTVPGFSPGLQKLTGRGETLRGRNPLYLIDGVPQHNALRDGQRDGHSIDLDFVERIEVVNGSNAIQGVGATGGVVQIVTANPARDERWRATVKARVTAGGGFEDDSLGYKASVLSGRRFGPLAVTAGVALHERGLQYDASDRPVGLYPTQGDSMDSTSLDLFFKAAFEIGDSGSLTLMANDFELERNGDFRAVPGDRDAGLPSGTVPGDPSAEVGAPARNDVRTVSLTWREDDLAGGQAVAQWFGQAFDGRFEGGTFGGFFRLTPDGEPFLDQSAVVSDKTGLKFAWTRPVIGGLDATLGLDLFRDDSAQVLVQSGRQWVPETRFETSSPFAQLHWDINDALSLSAGLRREFASLEVDDYTTIASAGNTAVAGGRPEFTESLPNVGAVWRVSERLRFYAAVSEGFTMPDAGRVLRGVSTPGTDVDELLTLEPIVTDNREVGIEWTGERVDARIAWFESTADNGSRLQLNPAGIYEVERERTEIDGYELSLGVALTESWRVTGSYSHTDGRYDSDGDGAVDSDLDGLNVGPDRLNAAIEGNLLPDWTLRLQGAWLRDRNFDGPAAPADSDFDGYAIVDLQLALQTDAGRFGLAVDNLFNRDYITWFSQTEPAARSDTYFAGKGRTLSLSWQQRY